MILLHAIDSNAKKYCKINDKICINNAGWAKDAEYIVWLDADLVVLDIGMSIEDIVKSHPKADFIISRDPLPDEIYSIANTGAIIMKNSKWSKAFLTKWWTMEDRKKAWEQHVLTKLFKQFESKGMGDLQYDQHTIHDRIALLRPDAINTNRPATINQKPYNQVLHMIGSLPTHRIKVFKTGLQEICNVIDYKSNVYIENDGTNNEIISSSSSLVLKQQLGLTKETLMIIEKEILGNRDNVANIFMNELQHTWSLEKPVALERVDFLHQKYDELLRLGYN